MRLEIKEKIEASPEAQVNLERMEIMDEEIGEIVQAIQEKRPKVQSILLSNNKIGDIGAKELANRLVALTSLSFLDLQFNQIDEEGASALFTELKGKTPQFQIALHANKIKDVATMLRIENSAATKKPSFKL